MIAVPKNWEALMIYSFLGIICFMLIAWLVSENRKEVSWRIVIWGVLMQFVLGFFVLTTETGKLFISKTNDIIMSILSFQEEGSRFLFNTLAIPPGEEGSMGFFFAFQALTTIIFFSSLVSVLYHFRIMQTLVFFIAKVMQWAMTTSGAETMATSSNIFYSYIL